MTVHREYFIQAQAPVAAEAPVKDEAFVLPQGENWNLSDYRVPSFLERADAYPQHNQVELLGTRQRQPEPSQTSK